MLTVFLPVPETQTTSQMFGHPYSITVIYTFKIINIIRPHYNGIEGIMLFIRKINKSIL